MSKQLMMWCVFDPDDKPLLSTLYDQRNKSIEEFIFWQAEFEWARFRRKGYTCRKVRVTIEEVKP